MNDKRMKTALENIARRGVPENTNLWPELAVKIERKSIMFILRTRPIMAISIALIAIFALSGVAYALGKVFGYIPGVGIVDQSIPLRVLAEPVSQTRDEITITVKEAVISSDKTIIMVTVENVNAEKLSSPMDIACRQWPQLYLADGTLLKVNRGNSNIQAPEFDLRLIYPSVPTDVNNVTLQIPCIQRAVPGMLPENWELPLRFIPASANTTVLPVVEVTPVAETKNNLTITNVIETSDSYILAGEFEAQPATSEEVDSGVSTFRLTDGNGQDTAFEYLPEDVDLPTPISPTAEPWSVKFNKGVVLPIRIDYIKQYILPDLSEESIEFDFDAGENPQEGQTWHVGQEFELAGHKFTLTSVSVRPYSYEFDFASTDKRIYSVGIDIEGYPPIGNGGGMDASAIGQIGSWSVSVGPYTSLPKGKIKVILSHLWYVGEIKNWTIMWNP